MRILVACQNDRCAEETSWTLDMVRMFEGEPVCENCYMEGDYNPEGCAWTELPEISLEDKGREKLVLILSMVQDLARKMLETGGADPYDFEAHKKACGAMTSALSTIAKFEDVK